MRNFADDKNSREKEIKRLTKRLNDLTKREDWRYKRDVFRNNNKALSKKVKRFVKAITKAGT